MTRTGRRVLFGSFQRILLISAAICMGGLDAFGGASDAAKLRPPPAPAGFQQMLSPAFVIQTDVSKSYLNTLTRQVFNAEKRMYSLFKISYGFLKGNDPKSKLDKRVNIRGDILSKWGYKPWIEVRVYKKFEDYTDEWFDESNRLEAAVNKTKIRKETPEQRAMRRLTEGIPGAYYMRMRDYDNKYVERRIRCYLGRKSPDELESDILHELGHLFLETFLMEFAGAPKKGQEDQKRGTPAWIGEGVAQLFEVNWAKSHTSRKKKNQYNAMIYEAIKEGDTYPFAKFINITNAHNLQDVAKSRLKATINYAQSYSVMQYMVERDWQRFLQFLENCRAMNLQKMSRQRGRISELYSIQDAAFKKAFTIPIVQVEKYWTKYVTETMEKKLKAKPGHYYWCGEYFLRKKDLAKAEDRFKKAIEGAPNDAGGYLGMGRVALSKGDVKSAVTNLTKAAKLDPKNEDAFYYGGVALVRAGKIKEAIKSLDHAVKAYPLFHQAYSVLGDAHYEGHDYRKALDSYQKAFDISKHPQYLLRIGHAAFFAREFREAMKNYAAFTNIFKRDARGHFWYGMSAWRLDQKEFALKKLQEAVKLSPNTPMYKQALAKAKKGETLTFTRENPISRVKKPDPKKIKPPADDEEEEEE